MPWAEIKRRRFPALDRDLDGISRETVQDHYKLYEGYVEAFFRNVDSNHVDRQVVQAEAARDGADRSGAREPAHAT